MRRIPQNCMLKDVQHVPGFSCTFSRQKINVLTRLIHHSKPLLVIGTPEFKVTNV